MSAVDRRLFERWLRATVVGWGVGFLLILVGAILADIMLGGDGDAQFMVGTGMGAGVGYMQGRVAKQWLGAAWPWAAASTIGIGGPFIVSDVAAANQIAVPFSLPLYVLVGSAVVGCLQWRLLHARFDRAMWWVPASIGGWGLVAGMISLNETLLGGPSPLGAVLLLVVILTGGFIVGAITGATLVWKLQHSASHPPALPAE